MKSIFYKGGYKYQLSKEYIVDINIKPSEDIDVFYIKLTTSGKLTIKKGYAWDGPSGPTFDTKNFMRGSLVHDALYQLMRGDNIDKATYRKPADKLLRKMCREDGMSYIRALWVYKAVHHFGNPSADPSHKKPVIEAPELD